MAEQDDIQLDRELRDAVGDEKADLADAIVFGLEVEHAISNSKTLSYLLDRAQAEIDAATMLFLCSSHLDTEEMICAHRRAHVARTIIDWLNEAVREGHEAAKAIKADEMMSERLEDAETIPPENEADYD
jgi:hypothetical protein